MNNKESLLAFENCLQAIEDGEDLESCLRRYPGYAEQLRPALEAAQLARTLSGDTIPIAGLHRSRTRILAIAADLRSRKSRRLWLRRYPRLVFLALLLAAFFFLSWRGLMNVSAKALPGDALYQVKLVGENLSLQLTPGSDTRRTMFAQFEQRRVEEVGQLLKLGRVVNVRFTGIVEKQQPGEWNVDGIEVRFDPNLQINGEISPGMVVQVAGQTQPVGWVDGSIINLFSYQFIGLVEAISRTEWDVSGVKLAINRSSQIDPAIRLGDMAIVLVQVNEDQSLRARAILRMLSHTDVPAELNAVRDRTAPVLPPLAIEVEFTGTVEEMTQDTWKIAGRQVTIGRNTDIEGGIFVGDSVSVHALMGGDGSLIAREIESAHGEMENDHEGEESGDHNGGSESGASGGGNGTSENQGPDEGGGGAEDETSNGGGKEDDSNQDSNGDDGNGSESEDDDSDHSGEDGNKDGDEQVDPDQDRDKDDGGNSGGSGDEDDSGEEDDEANP